MCENKISVLPDVIEPISSVVQQNIPETAKQTDGALSTVVGFFNNVVLYPVKKANLTFQYKLESFEDDLKEKIKHIPNENLQVPPTMIAGPTLEALRYVYDEEELREMYENLLASSMDNRMVSKAHPSFVDAIKQLSPLDARVFKGIIKYNEVVSAHMRICVLGLKRYYPTAIPYHFCAELYDIGNPFEISSSISNIMRLGLVRTYDTILKDDLKEKFLNHQYINDVYAEFPVGTVYKDIDAGGTVIVLDDYGKSFARTCIKNGGKM